MDEIFLYDEKDVDLDKADIAKSFGKFHKLPDELLDYSLTCLSQGNKHPLISALNRNVDKTFEALDANFQQTSGILKVSTENLFKLTDFDWNDQAPDRFDSMLAEFISLGTRT